MDKQSTYELQKIDCNCNDCVHMVRDIERHNKSLEFHKKLQKDYHDIMNRKNGTNKPFQFDRSEASIMYGNCSKLKKQVSFIPNVCTPENQKCFKHRKDLFKIETK